METTKTSSSIPPLAVETSLLRKTVEPSLLPFETTKELEVLDGVIEQQRALDALQMGLKIRKRNFNIFVAGSSGTGKSSILRNLLKKIAETEPVPPDWCMVGNYKRPDQPIVFSLPPGEGTILQKAMDQIIADLKIDLPKALHAKDHQERVQRIYNEQLKAENQSFLELTQEALEIGFAVKSNKDGLTTVPIVEGKPISNKDYAALDDKERKAIEKRRQKLEPVISRFLEAQRDIELGLHHKLEEAQRVFGKKSLDRHFRSVLRRFASYPEVVSYLEGAKEHILENLDRFLPTDPDPQRAERRMRRVGHEYRVNVLVDNAETKGAPVLFENTPTYRNLVGKVERRVENGIYSTDFMMVKAGSMLRANGGYLVLQAKDVVSYPFSWDALKRLLKFERVQIEEMGEDFQFLPTAGVRPEPIPVQCKVILIGANHLYEMFSHYDEDFSKTFQIKAEFDSEVKLSSQSVMDYARFIATTCNRDNLLPVNREGVATIIEFASRIAGANDRMTLRFNEICTLLIEADALAQIDGANIIGREHIERACDQKNRRICLIADRLREEVEEGTLILRTDGREIGVVNGLGVYEFADFAFGHPMRITAQTFQGQKGIINIERESRLSGSSHSKGVLITSGFLGSLFARKHPLSLTVTLTIEQTYSQVQGDSASLAGVCAILSSLADVPFRQDIAVTGSISQKGEVQAIGGVNEKIEGFFDVCKARGFTKTHGVIIPQSNIRHLMLKPEVIEAAKEGFFSIYAVATVEEAIAIMSDMPAIPSAGEYHSVYGRAARKLRNYYQRSKRRQP